MNRILLAAAFALLSVSAQAQTGRVTTSAPTYGNNTTAPVSIETDGDQRTHDTALGTAVGTTSGAAVITDANGAVQQYLRGLVKRWADALGAGTAAAALRVTLASDGPGVAALGATTGAAVITDADGSIQQYLRGLVKRWADALGAGTAAAALRTTLASDDPGVAALQAIHTALLDQIDVVIEDGSGVAVDLTQPDTAVRTSPATSTSEFTVVAANTDRKGLIIYNPTATTCLIAQGTGVTATDYTVELFPQQTWAPPDQGSGQYNGAYSGDCAAAAGDIYVTDLD